MSIETPSGKRPQDENFPVASKLISARYRPTVLAYYAFARAADDIADNASLPPDEKTTRLDQIGEALCNGTGHKETYAKAHTLRRALLTHQINLRRGLDLLDAFRQDALKNRYASWSELIAYCDRSAAPVGRFLLDLHGETPELYEASDALCNALQILNHLQDCGEDYRRLDRVYIPIDWLQEADVAVDALQANSASPQLRTVLDRCLDAVGLLLPKARELQTSINSRRLAMEASVITELAFTLARRLRAGDPLAGRVELNKANFAKCTLVGIAKVIARPACRLIGSPVSP